MYADEHPDNPRNPARPENRRRVAERWVGAGISVAIAIGLGIGATDPSVTSPAAALLGSGLVWAGFLVPPATRGVAQGALLAWVVVAPIVTGIVIGGWLAVAN
jgi:hypothetical protein